MNRESTVDKVSAGWLAVFHRYLNWYVPRHFHGLRVAHADRFPAEQRPLIVCINHASWWDPLVILLLSRFVAPGRVAYAPMEAEALQQYGFFKKIGAFAVDNRSPRAGAQFLKAAKDVLQRAEAVLWMTPEGKFTDVRQTVDWRPGTAVLTRILGDCVVVPLAIEYTFWDERLPEVLCMVGEPLKFMAEDTADTEQRSLRLQTALSGTQKELAACVVNRSAAGFQSVFSAHSGVSATYDLWRRVKALCSGRPYIADHGAIAPK